MLSGQHLITRLTNNNGNYTFDAAVKLSLNATSASGEPIWNANDGLPADDDYLAVIIDCMNGDDRVTIGPTVQKTVWTDGGYGDDVVETMSGITILPDKTEGTTRNDTTKTAYNLGRAWLMAANGPTDDERFSLSPLEGGADPAFTIFING